MKASSWSVSDRRTWGHGESCSRLAVWRVSCLVVLIKPTRGGARPTSNIARLPGLKFMRTLWVCDISGGRFQVTATKPGKTPLGLEEAHWGPPDLSSDFDEVAAELGRTLDVFKVPKAEKAEVLAPSPPTKTGSPPATSRPLSAAEAAFPSPNNPAQPKLGGIVSCAPTR